MSFWNQWRRAVAIVTGGGGAPLSRDGAPLQEGERRCDARSESSHTSVDKGLLVFHNTSEVIRAERLLREAGLTVEVMGPPPDLRTGCDMVLVFPLVSELVAIQTLESAGLDPLQVLPLCDLLLEPVSLFHSAWFGPYLMVRAANMKITVRLESRLDNVGCAARIVNVSGGGCPDVPYLASLLVGKTLEEADEPRVHGRTLCSYSLQKAFEEVRRVAASLVDCPEPSPVASGGELAEEKENPWHASDNLNRRPNPCARPWLVCGTVPDDGFPLMLARCSVQGDVLRLESKDGAPENCAEILVRRGTPALLAAAVKACEALGIPGPHALLVGDAGSGEGSRLLYRELSRMLTEQAQGGESAWAGLTFHYLFPDVDGHNQVLMALQEFPRAEQGLADRDSTSQNIPITPAEHSSAQICASRPILVADAGFMYAAKMSGYAASYDLFTPDAGELAFLADEKAPHPFYTRGFLLASDHDVPELIRKAYEHGNSARYLLIKGACDSVVRDGKIFDVVENPCVPAMEPIGGTGDFVTGMATAFLAGGYSMQDACLGAARGNRYVGRAANPAPDTQVAELLAFVSGSVLKAAKELES